MEREPGCRDERFECVSNSCVKKGRPVVCADRTCNADERCCLVASETGQTFPRCARESECISGLGAFRCSSSAACPEGFLCRGAATSWCRRGDTSDREAQDLYTFCESDSECSGAVCKDGVPRCLRQEDSLARCGCGAAPLAACTKQTKAGTVCKTNREGTSGHCYEGRCLDEAECRRVCVQDAKKHRKMCSLPAEACDEEALAFREGCLAELCER